MVRFRLGLSDAVDMTDAERDAGAKLLPPGDGDLELMGDAPREEPA
jgi:hypothetical protein